MTAFDRAEWLRSVGPVIETAVARPDTRSLIFHGCYDWHSAVHGHWALLRLARATGEQRFVDATIAELTADRIAGEAAQLRERPGFEMPYGRAWLLRLAIEHATVTGSDALHGVAAEVAQSLVERYDHVAPHPASREYDNASWAMVQLAAWARHAEVPALTRWVGTQIDRAFLDPGDVPGMHDDRVHPDFFSPRANWLYLIAHAQPAALRAMLDAAALDERVLAPVEITRAAHHHGVNWCRAWMLHRLALQVPDEPLFRDAFDAHVATGVRDHDRALGNYRAYDHWVPQFAVYALTEELT